MGAGLGNSAGHETCTPVELEGCGVPTAPIELGRWERVTSAGANWQRECARLWHTRTRPSLRGVTWFGPARRRGSPARCKSEAEAPELLQSKFPKQWRRALLGPAPSASGGMLSQWCPLIASLIRSKIVRSSGRNSSPASRANSTSNSRWRAVRSVGVRTRRWTCRSPR